MNLCDILELNQKPSDCENWDSYNSELFEADTHSATFIIGIWRKSDLVLAATVYLKAVYDRESVWDKDRDLLQFL